MARRDVPCTIICRSSLDPVVVDGARVGPDAVGIGIEIEAVSRVVVRCGAASVGAANVPCNGESRVDATAVTEAVLVWVDLIDVASSEVLVGTVEVASPPFTLGTVIGPLLGGAGVRMEIPRVPNTLLVDFRRATGRLGAAVDNGVSEGRGFSSDSSPGP